MTQSTLLRILARRSYALAASCDRRSSDWGRLALRARRLAKAAREIEEPNCHTPAK